jgi:phage shock protein A
MAEEKIGIFRAILRYFRFWNWKKARGIIKAADEQFAGSVDGISAAFDIQKDKMVSQYQGLRDAISEVEAVLEDKRARLEALNQEEEELLGKREGALAMAEKAKEADDMKEYEKHAHAFERFQVRIEEIDTAQERLNKEVTEASGKRDKYMLQLSDFQAQIEKMPQNKAEAIADFVSAKQIIELNDRLQGLETSLDRGPISAVLETNKRLTAKARISQKLANTDVRLQDKEYERAGRESTAKSKMEQMLAARKVEKEQKTGEKAETAAEKADDRPKI